MEKETIDYKSNSKNTKEEIQDVRVKQIINSTVKTRKKNSFVKLKDEIISDDASNIKSYVFGEVLIPALKKAISDVVTNGIDIILYGESRSKNGSTRTNADRVSYRSYYDQGGSRFSPPPVRAVNNYDYDDIILNSRGEAEEVLERMDELISIYGIVRVADLYDLVGLSCEYTDNKYGWANLRQAQIQRVRDGYMIKMPKAMPID